MTKDRDRIEAYLGLRLPEGMVEDAAALAEVAATAARAAASRLKEPHDSSDFLEVLESLAGDRSPSGDRG